MSTWRIEQDVMETEKLEAVMDSGGAESCFARNVASFGMINGRYDTIGRMKSEDNLNRDLGSIALEEDLCFVLFRLSVLLNLVIPQHLEVNPAEE
jgi:hypothetical protein